MKAEDEIKELDQMVNDRDALIRALVPTISTDLTKRLTGNQQRLLERICAEA